MLIRYVHEWEVKMRLVRFQLVKSSVNGDELARIIIEVLHRKLDVLQNNLVAAMRDRARDRSMVRNEKLTPITKILTTSKNSLMFVFCSSTGAIFSISLNLSQLSRNSLKICSFPLGVLVLLLFGNFIHIFVANHNKYCCGYYSKQRTNQVHFAKFEKAEIVRPSLGLHAKGTPRGSRMLRSY